MVKLGETKTEKNIVLCYIAGIIISGIVIAVWTALVVHWTIALFFLGCWYFAFLIMPFGMDMEGREDAQHKSREKDKKKYEYRKKRGWA